MHRGENYKIKLGNEEGFGMIVSLNNVGKTYKRGSRTVYAVKDVSLQVNRGDFVNIIGRSGSGKSTLLNLIAGMVTPSSGEISIRGENLSSKTDKDISYMRNQFMGFIPQGTATLPNLNVLDNVALPFFLHSREGDPFGKAQVLLDLLGISDLSGAYPRELSGGEQRRTLIARALMNEPEILIADEPTGDLDIENTKEVMETFAKINERGTTVLLVSHELDTLSYGKTIYTMVEGVLKEGNLLEAK